MVLEGKMSYQDFMNKVRYWDNMAAKWMLRHFYILFFEFFLVALFLIFFFNTVQFIDYSFDIGKDNTVERLLLTQTVYNVVIVLLLLLNSFWMLYIFNCIMRIQSTLKDLNFNLSKRRD